MSSSLLLQLLKTLAGSVDKLKSDLSAPSSSRLSPASLTLVTSVTVAMTTATVNSSSCVSTDADKVSVCSLFVLSLKHASNLIDASCWV